MDGSAVDKRSTEDQHAAFTANLPPIIPRETLFGNPDRADPKISPDGRMLAYLAPSEGVLNVWLRSLEGGDDRVITSDRKRGVRSYAWRADSRHILYMQDQDGDENFHLYMTDISTRSTRDLTPFAGARAQFLVTDYNHPDHLLIGLNVRDARLFDMYRVDLESGALELAAENPGDVSAWSADHDLRVRIAEVTLPDGGTEIRKRDADGWTTLTTWGPDETLGGVAGFTPDNRGVVMLCSVGYNSRRLVEMDLSSGESRVLAEDPRYDAASILTHPTNHSIQAVQFVTERSQWQVLDAAIAEDFRQLGEVRAGDFAVVSRDSRDENWTVAYTTDNGPVYFYHYKRSTGASELLFSNRSDLERYKMAEMRPIRLTAEDGLPLEGYLTLPVGLPPRSLPAVLLVHGGPWGRDLWGFSQTVQWLANRGYVVIQINFRGSTGYGKEHLNAGDREWAGKMQTDLLDAKRWAIQQGFVDPQRVAIMGGSYGGYATLVGLAFTPDEFACGVDIVGPSNLLTLIRSIPPYWAPLMAVFSRRVGSIESDQKFLLSRSPLQKAGQITAPLLIAQGANDPRVKQVESDQIVRAMRERDKTVEYIVFPDEGHGFVRPENNMRFYAAAEEFLARYLGGRYEPASPAESVEEFRR